MSRECTLRGYAICKVDIGVEKIVSTYVQLDCTYYADWQCEAHCYHDEGFYDYDIDDIEILYPDEYIIFNYDGTTTTGDKPIKRLLEVLVHDLREV